MTFAVGLGWTFAKPYETQEGGTPKDLGPLLDLVTHGRAGSDGYIMTVDHYIVEAGLQFATSTYYARVMKALALARRRRDARLRRAVPPFFGCAFQV